MAKGRLRLENIPSWEEVQKLWDFVLDRFTGSGDEARKIKRELLKEGYRPIYTLREVCFFGLLFFTGCRISELLAIRKKDISFVKKTILIRQLKKRKGQELIREVLLPPPVEDYLREYVISEVIGDEFLLFDFSRQRAWQLVKELSIAALNKPLHPHVFRHAFAIQLLKSTSNMEYVRRLLGHKDYDTLKHYLDFTIEDMKEDILKVFEERK
ncbi:tyrosine-type recombinase/integrase [Desulfurobacterium atlanticum]|uniref:Phage integrase family protein n=1 Tax=Desulfurobacterium atlanticum TaxID=240169 RepID=A0A238ZKL4_9BACT|nr:site-specific integrase [Desulfurobacterium atlanticum]SNR83234.1 Phage integrase family protein [Desulfurobacterium atlanticum]